MWPESSENNTPLRTGFTTGTCATACSVAAATYLLSSAVLSKNNADISIILPKGKTVELLVNLESQGKSDDGRPYARVSTIKDAGDDPDITHGAVISVSVILMDTPGCLFKAGEGVGTVTREGLALNIGEPAINPIPRKMMQENLALLSKHVGYQGGFDITISIAQGETLAQKTMNPRLGIIGGLSILGTTGIVRPFSCGAWIASIYQGIDVARANGITHLAATTGNTSEGAIQEKYNFTDMALIEMGDFAGAMLKHIRKNPVAKLSLCGGFGKLTKLAHGHMDLHSRSSAIDLNFIARSAKNMGASDALVEKIKSANTSIEALGLSHNENILLGDEICRQALSVAKSIVLNDTQIEIYAVDRQGRFVGSASA